MKKSTIASAATFFAILLHVTTASACGDKLLYLSRIYHHHSLADNTVAVYARPNSVLENVAALNLDKAFHEAGYRLILVRSDHDLANALQSGAADIIIADIADAPAIEQSALAARIPISPS